MYNFFYYFIIIGCVGKHTTTGHGKANCDKNDAATALREAMKDYGRNEYMIIKTLTACTNAQRIEIVDTYKLKYDRNLIKDFKSELSGDLKDAVLSMMEPISLFLANEIREALEVAGTDEETLVEILFPLTSEEIELIETDYEKTFKSSLVSDFKTKKYQHVGFLLEYIRNEDRDRTNFVNKAKAENDARTLISNSSAVVWAPILRSRNFAYLNVIYEKFKAITGIEMLDWIDKNTRNPLKTVYTDMIHYILDSSEYFASRIYMALNRSKVNKKALTRLFVTRSEIDLMNVSRNYLAQYKTKLEDDIEKLHCGYYCILLQAILINANA